MSRFNFTLIILSLTFANSFSQNNWKEGYIIQINNDTISGFIDDRGSKSNTKNCYFKETLDNKVTNYSPEEIHGYRFKAGKFYISKRIDNETVNEPLFLEFLIKGEINIYHTKTEIDRYFIEKDTLFYELKNTTVPVTIKKTKDGREYGKVYEYEYIKEANEYKGLLNYLMQDANMSKKIFQSSLDSKSLINISKKYHETVCLDEECIIFEKSERKLNVIFGIHAGMSLNYLNFGNKLKSEYSQGALIGCRFIFNNAFDWLERVDFHIDLNLQKFSEYRLYAEDGIEQVTYENIDYRIGEKFYNSSVEYLDVNINTTALKIPMTVNYVILGGAFKPYIGLGLTNTIVLSQNKEFIYHYYYNKFDQSIPPYTLGYTGKIGGSHKIKNGNIYFDLIFEYAINLVSNTYLYRDQLFSFNLGYAF